MWGCQWWDGDPSSGRGAAESIGPDTVRVILQLNDRRQDRHTDGHDTPKADSEPECLALNSRFKVAPGCQDRGIQPSLGNLKVTPGCQNRGIQPAPGNLQIVSRDQLAHHKIPCRLGVRLCLLH